MFPPPPENSSRGNDEILIVPEDDLSMDCKKKVLSCFWCFTQESVELCSQCGLVASCDKHWKQHRWDYFPPGMIIFLLVRFFSPGEIIFPAGEFLMIIFVDWEDTRSQWWFNQLQSRRWVVFSHPSWPKSSLSSKLFLKSRPHQGRRRNMFSDPSRSAPPSWKEACRHQGHQEGRGESWEDS